MKCDRPTRRSFAWLCRVQTDFRVISRTVSALGLAERVGFEPTLPFRVNTLSKRAPSATRPSLRRECCDKKQIGKLQERPRPPGASRTSFLILWVSTRNRNFVGPTRRRLLPRELESLC